MARKRRNKHARDRRGHVIEQAPWRRLRNPFAPLEILSAEHVESIHDASLTVLERYGIEFRHAGALDLLQAAGADVDRDSRIARFDRELVMETVSLAPREFTMHARNADRHVTFGANHINFDSVGGPPNGSDADAGRRMGTFKDFSNFVRLAQSLNVLHLVGGSPIAPVDLDAHTRHLDSNYAYITLTDKVWHTIGIGRERVTDAVDMLCITHGLSRDELSRTPCTFSIINVNSPRRYDESMLAGLIEMARSGQVACVTPFTLSGAMSPITIAGALTQQNAEALAGIALTQIVNPGAPVMYGGFTSNVDMKTGSPAFGTPEYAQACLASGQLARRYGLPYRSSNTNASNAVDAQSTYETSMSIWGSIMGHANLLHHGAGWLEGGLTASFEKAVIDAEMLQMMAALLEPLEVCDETLALEAIGAVAPGGHFFGAEHTLSRYESAFYKPIVSDWRNFETWREAGSLTATERASLVWKRLLEEYEPPPIDPAIDEALREYVERRKTEYDVS
ncbi:MAG: trimethylamine methyltransferase family protein [Gammaproteobacteria bacterium]